MSKSIEKLRQSSTRLNEITDRAAETVHRVEVFLNQECKAGISACVRVEEEVDPTSGSASYLDLCYCRVHGKYRIAVADKDDGDPDDWCTTPWSDCTRNVKLRTVEKLPDLIKQIVANVEEKIKRVDQISAVVTGLMQSIDKKGR